MIESTTRDYIQNATEIPTYLDAPAEKPDEYIRIRKSGSSGNRHIETSIFICLCISNKSLFNAAEMNEKLKNAMYDMPGCIAEVSKVELNSDGNFTDTTTKEYRYQAIFEIIYHR